MGIKC